MSSTTFFADGIDGEVEFLQLQHLITEYVTAIQSMSVVLQIIDVDCQYRGNFVHVMDDDGAMPPSKRPRIHALPLEDVPRAPPRSAKLLFDEFYHRNPDPRAFRAMCRMFNLNVRRLHHTAASSNLVHPCPGSGVWWKTHSGHSRAV